MTRLWLLAAAVTVGQLANSAILPAVPLLARDLSVPASSAGLVVTVYFGGFALAGPFAGPLSDRFGRRPILLGGLAMLAAGSIACAFAASLSALLLCRLLQALGAAGTPVLARAIVRDTRKDRDLAGALGLLATGMGLSPVLGPLLGGLLAHAVGWRWLFGFVAALAAAAAFAAWAGIAETLAPRASRKPGGPWHDMRMLLRQPRFRRGVLYAGASYTAFGALYTAAPFVLMARFGLSHLEFGVVFALIGLCVAGGGILGPRLIPVIGETRLLEGAAGLAIASSLLLFALAATGEDSAATVALCFALFALAFGVALSVGGAMTLGGAGEVAGTASSLAGSLQLAMAAIGSAASNLLPGGSLMSLAVLVSCTGLAALFTVRGMRQAGAA